MKDYIDSHDSEEKILNSIRPYVDKLQHNILGFDEDAVSVRLSSKNAFLTINTDSWVASTDRPQGLDLESCGYRAVLNSASDLIAKQIYPQWMVISLTIPKSDSSQIIELVKGFERAASEYNIAYLGGDLNSGCDTVIDVTVFGEGIKPPLKRSTAKKGELVCWIGPPLGKISGALGVLTKNWIGDKPQALDIYGSPYLPLEFVKIKATSAIDSSDGIAKSLSLLSTLSKVKISLDQLNTTSNWVLDLVRVNQLDLQDVILFGGEELGIIFTCEPTAILPDEVVILGNTSLGSGVHVDGRRVSSRGWDHFD